MDDLKAIGLALKAMREAKGLTMRDLAQKAGLSVSTVFVIENGQREPNFKSLFQICQVLNTRPSELLSLADKLSGELGAEIQSKRDQLRREREELKQLSKVVSTQISALMNSPQEQE